MSVEIKIDSVEVETVAMYSGNYIELYIDKKILCRLKTVKTIGVENREGVPHIFIEDIGTPVIIETNEYGKVPLKELLEMHKLHIEDMERLNKKLKTLVANEEKTDEKAG